MCAVAKRERADDGLHEMKLERSRRLPRACAATVLTRFARVTYWFVPASTRLISANLTAGLPG